MGVKRSAQRITADAIDDARIGACGLRVREGSDDARDGCGDSCGGEPRESNSERGGLGVLAFAFHDSVPSSGLGAIPAAFLSRLTGSLIHAHGRAIQKNL